MLHLIKLFKYRLYRMTVCTILLCMSSSFGQLQIPINLGISDSNHFVRIANSALAFPLPPHGTILHLINNGVSNGRLALTSYYSGGVQGSSFTGMRARGTTMSPTAVQTNDILSVLNAMGYGSTRFPTVSSGSFAIRAEAAFTDNSKPTYLSFLTAPVGDTNNVERMRIKSDGTVQMLSMGAGFMQTDASGNSSSTPLSGSQVNAALGYTAGDAAAVSTNTSNIATNTSNIALKVNKGDSGRCGGCWTTGYDLNKKGDSVLALIPTNNNTLINGAGYLNNTTGDARYPQLSGSYSNPLWITSLAAAKVSGLATVATTGVYSDLSGKPTIYSFTGSAGQYTKGDGTYGTLPSPGTGTVTSIGLTSSDITVGGTSPITSSGTYTLTLPTVNSNVGTFNNITINAKGQATAGNNVSYLTANQPITVTATGDATGTSSSSGTAPGIALTLANTAVTPATYGSATQSPVFTVDSKGRITGVINTTITATATGTAGGDLSGSYPNPLVIQTTGTTAGGNATAGKVGEYVESKIASASGVTITNATATNVTSISLTAGDWDVEANCNYSSTLATVSGKTSAISTTSATLPTDGSEVNNGLLTTLITGVDGNTMPRKRVNVTTTTTVYLVAQCAFTLGGVKCYGVINARRVR